MHRLIAYSEREGLVDNRVLDAVGSGVPSFRLWPKLERIRALGWSPLHGVDIPRLVDDIIRDYLDAGPAHGWIDRLDADGKPVGNTVPASMFYHIMSELAPLYYNQQRKPSPI